MSGLATATEGSASQRKASLVAIGASAGGVAALSEILPALPADFPLPVVVVVHVPPARESLLADLFGKRCRLSVVEAEDKTRLDSGRIYFSPPDYHLMIEEDLTCSLSVDEPVNFSRPSIDVLLESAASSLGDGVIAIILTGTSADGARGLRAVRAAGGIGWVQAPETAQSALMPQRAIEVGGADAVLSLPQIAQRLARFAREMPQ
ncbi:MAG: chemotaxis protein CheB [Burkholderiaceae bacterium]|nr:chemotaxis protein CheB [Burkholderiaceae bacterium]